MFLGILATFFGWDWLRFVWDLGPGDVPTPEEEGARAFWQKVEAGQRPGIGPRDPTMVLRKWNKVYKRTSPDGGDILLLIE